jgi:processive 1,2-diacylglycerol beta-glucosyltransferase
MSVEALSMKNTTVSDKAAATITANGILILHATAGAGHTRAAQAIAAALKARGEAHQLVDILDCTPALFRRMYVKSYIDLVQKAPELWGYLYDRTDVVRPATSKRVKARLAFNQLNSLPFKKLLKEASPRAIVCTHFLPLELLSDLKGRGKIDTPVHAVVTDVSPHALWVYPNIDCYHVATRAAARELERKGFPAERIRVTGIPVDPVFAERTTGPAARKKLGLPEKPTVLMLSGGFGVGPMTEALESFRGSSAEISLVVVAGKNAELEAKCRAVAKTLRVPVTVHGFVTNMHELMDAADLIVTKPGGLTTTEVLAKGKPMALVSPIPGQEQRNCEYLLEAGAAVRLYDVADAAFYLTEWLADAERMKRMTAAAKAIARPRAAEDIAAAVVGGV